MGGLGAKQAGGCVPVWRLADRARGPRLGLQWRGSVWVRVSGAQRGVGLVPRQQKFQLQVWGVWKKGVDESWFSGLIDVDATPTSDIKVHG